VWNSCVGWWGGIAYVVLGQGVPTIRKGKTMSQTNIHLDSALRYRDEESTFSMNEYQSRFSGETHALSITGDRTEVNIYMTKEQVEQLFGTLNNHLQAIEDKRAHAEAVALAQFDAQRDDQVESISLA